LDSKQVSFLERIEKIEADGTIGFAVLKKQRNPADVLVRHTSLPLEFDFGRCEMSDDSHEDEETTHPANAAQERFDLRSSYKKFAPRSKLAYCKRTSI